MKRLLWFLILIGVGFDVFAQNAIKTEKVSEWSLYIKASNFEGVIFSKDFDSRFLIGEKFTKFSPVQEEVLLAEEILDKGLDTIANSRGKNRFIHKNIATYCRQYFGYINEDGDKIIYLNAFSKPSNEPIDEKWLRQLNFALDGGPAYWQIRINVTKQILFDFRVNVIG